MSAPTYTPVIGERSGVTLVDNALGLRRGDRIRILDRRAVVAHADDYTLTVAYRDAWYWRIWWFALDDWSRTKDDARKALAWFRRAVPDV